MSHILRMLGGSEHQAGEAECGIPIALIQQPKSISIAAVRELDEAFIGRMIQIVQGVPRQIGCLLLPPIGERIGRM